MFCGVTFLYVSKAWKLISFEQIQLLGHPLIKELFRDKSSMQTYIMRCSWDWFVCLAGFNYWPIGDTFNGGNEDSMWRGTCTHSQRNSKTGNQSVFHFWKWCSNGLTWIVFEKEKKIGEKRFSKIMWAIIALAKKTYKGKIFTVKYWPVGSLGVIFLTFI